MCCYLFCGTQKDKFLLRTLVCKRAVEHEDTLLCFKWQHMGCRLNNDYSWSRIEIHKSNSKIFSISLTNKFNWVCIESFCFMASQNKQWTGWAESYLLHTLISGFTWLLSLSCFIFWMNKEQMIHSWQYNHKTWWPPITFADKAISTGQGQWWLRVLLSHFRYIWTQWNLLIRVRWDLGYGNFLYKRRRIWWETD